MSQWRPTAQRLHGTISSSWNLEYRHANPLMVLTWTHPRGWTALFWRENCLSHATAQPRKGTVHSSTGGALIFWLLPIVVVVVDTRVHCELGHLSSHSGSQQIPALRGAANRALYGDNSTAERQTTKQMSASYFTLYHRLSISFSLSLSVCHISSTLSYFVSAAVINFAWQQQGQRDGAVCVRSFFLF